jgi:surfeit locus 1 family protein
MFATQTGRFGRSTLDTVDRWYSRDVTAIATAKNLGIIAPYFLDQYGIEKVTPGIPVSGLTAISFHNSHLVYALTWFALSIMADCGVVLLLIDRRRAKKLDETP